AGQMVGAGVGKRRRKVGTGRGVGRRERLVVVAAGRGPGENAGEQAIAHRGGRLFSNEWGRVTSVGARPQEATAAPGLRAVRGVVRIPEPVGGDLGASVRNVLVHVSLAAAVIEPAGDLAPPNRVDAHRGVRRV